MEIKSLIRKHRRSKNITQEQMAKYLYTTKSTISKWESGAIVPSLKTIKSISNYLEIDLIKFIKNENNVDESLINAKPKFKVLSCNYSKYENLKFSMTKIGKILLILNILQTIVVFLIILITILTTKLIENKFLIVGGLSFWFVSFVVILSFQILQRDKAIYNSRNNIAIELYESKLKIIEYFGGAEINIGYNKVSLLKEGKGFPKTIELFFDKKITIYDMGFKQSEFLINKLRGGKNE